MWWPEQPGRRSSNHATARLHYDGWMTTPQPSSGFPEAETPIDLALVERLIADQAPPQWAQLPVAYLATGWDNEVYRLGETLLIRLPRRTLAAHLAARERLWLARFSTDSGLDLGAPLFTGNPTAEYPWSFSICRYVPGVSAALLTRGERDAYAPGFAAYLRSLHAVAPKDAPRSEFRGRPLHELDDATRERIGMLPGTDRAAARAIWEAGLRAEPYAGPARWLHGDPHPHNTIVRDSGAGHVLAALVDFGDVCAGDPASDLGMLWLHFTDRQRDRALRECGVEPGSPTWLRARGWALRYAMLIAPLGTDDPLGRIGAETLGILLAG